MTRGSAPTPRSVFQRDAKGSRPGIWRPPCAKAAKAAKAGGGDGAKKPQDAVFFCLSGSKSAGCFSGTLFFGGRSFDPQKRQQVDGFLYHGSNWRDPMRENAYATHLHICIQCFLPFRTPRPDAGGYFVGSQDPNGLTNWILGCQGIRRAPTTYIQPKHIVLERKFI